MIWKREWNTSLRWMNNVWRSEIWFKLALNGEWDMIKIENWFELKAGMKTEWMKTEWVWKPNELAFNGSIWNSTWILHWFGTRNLIYFGLILKLHQNGIKQEMMVFSTWVVGIWKYWEFIWSAHWIFGKKEMNKRSKYYYH